MDWVSFADYLLRYLEVLVWPTLIALLALVFRRELTKLLARLHRARLPGGAEFEFEDQLSATEKQRLAVSPEIREATARIETDKTSAKKVKAGKGGQTAEAVFTWPSDKSLGQLHGLAEGDPNLALAALRIEIERRLMRMADASLNMKFFPDLRGANQLLSVLTRMQLIPPSISALTTEVVRLCNAAVHGADISKDQAARVITLAADFETFYDKWEKTILPTLPK